MKNRMVVVAWTCSAASMAFADVVSFVPAAPILAAQRPSGVAIADFTGDGRADIAVTVDTPDRVLMFAGNADGTFAAPTTRVLPNGAGAGDIVAIDADGDTDMDIAVCYQNLAQVQVLTNTAGVFALGPTATVGTNPRGIRAANIDGDGDTDLAVVNRDSGTVSVLTNTGAGFTVASQNAGTDPWALAFGDTDGDGDGDMAVASHGDRVVRLFSNSAGVFAPGATLAVPNNDRPGGVAIAHIAGSALPEVLATSDDNGAGFVSVFANTGGVFAGGVRFPTLGQNSGPVMAVDVDLDADMDVVVANSDSGNISVLLNLGTGALGGAVLLGTGAGPTALDAGSVNAGVMPDLVVANRDANTVTVLLNTAQPPTPACDTIDFNQDGLFPDTQDITDFIAVFGGAPCPTGVCGDIDFNNDGLFPDTQDITTLITVFAGGACS
ncbi:MAG TPA: VCBS repeat-containing protein [Phycisphaerales bacterium]|nr:VCBS repeat-containing protein [Phycisphaerales bacterium]